MKKHYRIIKWFALSLALMVVGCRIYFQFVPLGVRFPPIAYLLFTHPPRKLVAPNGAVFVIMVNDAGAMHSGHHWVWIIRDTDLIGKVVVAQGYWDAKTVFSNNDKLHIEFSDGMAHVEFRKSRSDWKPSPDSRFVNTLFRY